MDRKLIEEYARGATQLAEAVSGLSREELNAFPVPGTWSIQQVMMHLMDSDLIASDRMKRIVSQENPTIIAYDETAFSRKLHYDAMDASMACEVFRLNRLLTAELLRRLPDEAFERIGTHNEDGRVTLGGLVGNYVRHLAHHLKFIHEKRRLLGK